MSYVLGQYNKNKTIADDDIFMTFITTGTPKRRQVINDNGVSGDENFFTNECCYVSSQFSTSKNYYFHGKIQRMLSAQTIYIKLTNFEIDPQVGDVEQYIKTITIAGGNVNEWVDIEFMFTPLITFDTIIFELQRTIEDYRSGVRYPIIAYQELSQIDNLITARIGSDLELIKIGVQSHPGLMMCINGEEIHTPRSGIYELKNGIMTVSFFSIVAPGKENTSSLENWMATVNNRVNDILRRQAAGQIDAEQAAAEKALINSQCFFSTSKKRTIDSFTMDYIYREE